MLKLKTHFIRKVAMVLNDQFKMPRESDRI